MIRTLRVRNFGVIEEVEVELGAGLTVLTGETGAGKSMLIDALVLLSGGRADSSMIRAECGEASVEGVFVPNEIVLERLVESGLECAGEEMLVRRTIASSGRSRGWINGCLVTANVLQQVMRGFIDIAGQLEHASLYDEDRHRSLVDRFGGLEARPASVRDPATTDGPKGTYEERYRRHQQAVARLHGLGGNERDFQTRLEFVRFQVRELVDAKVGRGEEANLEQLKRRLAGSARLEALARFADDALMTRDGSAVELMGEAAQRLAEMEKVDATVTPIRERVAAASLELEEAGRTLGRYLASLESDPAKLRETEERLDVLRSLARKHLVAVDDLPMRLSELEQELDALLHREEHRASAECELSAAAVALTEAANALRTARMGAAAELERSVSDALGRLALKNARFSVEVAPVELGPEGGDLVRFLFSANPGEPLKPLAKTASGGEASRVMLAIKAVLSTIERVGVSVLDEVDAGVGGAVADVVGRLIRDLSTSRQVLCITHVPQVAAYAQQHVRIEKRMLGGRVQSSVSQLTSMQSRSEELARMLSGERVSKEAKAAAQVLLMSATKREASPRPRGKAQVTEGGNRRLA